MAFKVTLKTPSGEQVIECSGDTYILDAAEEAGKYRARIRRGFHVVGDGGLFRNSSASIPAIAIC
jgi:hypothetical protein